MSSLQQIAVYGMAVFYIAAGVNHFVSPKFYVGIMPEFFPAKELLNIVSGLAEIILGVLVIFPATRKISAHLIILMLAVFFTVHITHLFHPPAMAKGKYWFIVLRIPLQFVLIYWAWWVSKV